MAKKISIYASDNRFLGYIIATHEYAVELGVIQWQKGEYIVIFANHWRCW